jgi:hypothetical protein
MITVFIVAAGAMLCFGLGGIIARRPSTYIHNASNEDVYAKVGNQYNSVPAGEGRWFDTQGDVEITNIKPFGEPREKRDNKTTEVQKN